MGYADNRRTPKMRRRRRQLKYKLRQKRHAEQAKSERGNGKKR
jgi:hypothetical protein